MADIEVCWAFTVLILGIFICLTVDSVVANICHRNDPPEKEIPEE